jgi:hypothetical protein
MPEHPQEDDMGIRETINQRQRTTTGIVIAVVVVAIGAVVWSQRSPATRAEKAFYSDESGAGVFSDSIDRVYPFDHNGKLAYRAYVYQGSDGKQFVSYIARYNDVARAKLESLAPRQGDASVTGELAQARSTGIEVKKPGGDKWVPLHGPQGDAIASHPTLPDGSTARLVMP